MGFTKNLLGYIISLSVLLLFSCHPKKESTCNIEINSFSLSNNTILLKTKNNKSCKGFKIKLVYDKRIFTFYVNFEPKLVNDAPPEGFSVKIQGKHYLSFGVDGNIIERNLPVYLKSESRIRSLENGVLVKWVIKVMDISKISKIKIGGTTIEHPSEEDCRFAYNDYLTTPRLKEFAFYPFDKFLNFCKSRWITEKRGALFKEIFSVSDIDIKELRKKGDKNLLKFMGILKQKNYTPSKKCKIHILIFHSLNYRTLNPQEFSFHIKKLNKETYERSFKGSSIVVNKGIYVIEAKSNGYSGKSKAIICKGGEYYVAILVRSNI